MQEETDAVMPYRGFDQPTYTVPALEVFGEGLPDFTDVDALPPLIDPDPAPVVAPSDDSLVLVEHRRIRTLANYWHAGWDHAIAGTFLRRTAFDRLAAAATALPDRWGLAVFDAWRPLALQRELYEAAYADPATEPGFMAPVSLDPTTPPPHLTGGTVDLTLTYDGAPLGLGSGFDDTTVRAHTAHLEAQPGPDRDLRRALYQVMRAEDFVVLDCEWWHYEYGTRRWAAITGQSPIYGPASPS